MRLSINYAAEEIMYSKQRTVCEGLSSSFGLCQDVLYSFAVESDHNKGCQVRAGKLAKSKLIISSLREEIYAEHFRGSSITRQLLKCTEINFYIYH